MFKKIFTWLKELIVEEYKFIIFMVVSTILFLFPVNYYIIIGGDISDIDNRIVVHDGYDSKGSFNISYVSELKGRLGPYLLSYIIPSWDRESANDYKYDNKESIEDIEFRSKLDLVSSNSYAIKWAYKLANAKYEEVDTKVYVISVIAEYNDNLKVGDQIISVDGEQIDNIEEIRNYISKLSGSDKIKIKVIRAGREKEFTCNLYENEGRVILGVYLQEVSSYKTDPSVEINFKSRESGPSGGLITTLAIYDKLTKDDLTNSYKIAGTGTIEADGSIGEIGGVKYKLAGAVKNKADIFLVPNGNNYEECVKLQKKNKYKIKIIGVSNIEEAVSKLEELGE